jgi:hypothetical protein
VSDAAGHIRARRGDFTVGDREHRTRRRFAAAGLGHDGDIPEPVIGGLGDGGSGGEGGGRSEGESKKNLTNAVLTHESNPRFCVMTRLISSHCVQNLLRRVNSDCSRRIKHLICELVPDPEQKTSPLSAQKYGIVVDRYYVTSDGFGKLYKALF